ncbi:MAG: translation initiation factor IF-2 [Parcubacteria group bacterium Gr01-1014_18]|nr:MAG: translation initiation factor IF-2 [Parcubacteria group bacterium Greene0416_36]TSC81038.1 MAG: translation initiation factor IF-2 [Parcubacteria group bacterium Gr01-1014_18]TSC98960.1 MAG: translation initiation factor IF-2 [Parcubacteria group bacterium Greene1014_20]TSD06748.1 MAG: translation initiation factor IF-2 [Parcubacteria group bacterium Greene0714_2]
MSRLCFLLTFPPISTNLKEYLLLFTKVMNLSELARQLHVGLAELKDKLPKMGFDVGQKAIKVDQVVAQKVLYSWRRLLKELEDREKRESLEKLRAQKKQETAGKKVKVPAIVTVRDFATLLGVPLALVIGELMKNGVVASLNEQIDFDTCSIISQYLGIEIEREDNIVVEEKVSGKAKIQQILEEDQGKTKGLVLRPPVVVIMGHVDHGKTSLLDAIRKSHVAESESGGITQHIGAYQVARKRKKITFIDTPGHEAFTAMRSRGARIADIGVLVVAADDSVQPQTIESIKIIKDSGLELIVAINKIDKPGINLDIVKKDLSNNGLVPEDWGGKTICVPVSAKTGVGIDDLLDMALLVSDLHKDENRVNAKREAAGTIIESHIDKHLGPVATVLVQVGTLSVNDYLAIDGILYGKVRAMKDWNGEDVESATPSMPVKVIGFKAAPLVGDVVVGSVETTHHMERVKKAGPVRDRAISIVTSNREEDENESLHKQRINLILRADVLGSLEAIEESIEKIQHPEVPIKIVAKGLGAVTEADVLRGDATGGVVISFKMPLSQSVVALARDKSVVLEYHDIIFKLLEGLRVKMEEKLPPAIRKKVMGRLNVLAVFREEPKLVVLGGMVEEGSIEKDHSFDIERGIQAIGSGKITNVKSGKREITTARSGQECGLALSAEGLSVKPGDKVVAYVEEKIKRKLDEIRV